MVKCTSRIVVLVGIVAVIVMAGCASGIIITPPPGPQGNLGSVHGRVVVGLTNPRGFQGIIVMVGGQSAESDVNGFFTVTGITPNPIPNPLYPVTLDINPQTNLVVPPGVVLPEVRTAAGQTTELPNNIVLVDASEVPPEGP